MDAAIVAVAGTLAGSATTGMVHYFTTAWDRRRQELVGACKALIAALIKYRREQYKKIDARRQDREDSTEARDERWAAHSEVTVAIAAVQMATRDRRLRRLASEAVDATFAIGDAGEEDLPAARARSLAAHEALLDAAVKAVS